MFSAFTPGSPSLFYMSSWRSFLLRGLQSWSTWPRKTEKTESPTELSKCRSFLTWASFLFFCCHFYGFPQPFLCRVFPGVNQIMVLCPLKSSYPSSLLESLYLSPGEREAQFPQMGAGAEHLLYGNSLSKAGFLNFCTIDSWGQKSLW